MEMLNSIARYLNHEVPVTSLHPLLPAPAAAGDQIVGTDIFAHLVYFGGLFFLSGIWGVICQQAGRPRPETPVLTNLRSKMKGREGTWAGIVLRPQSVSSH